MDRFNDNIYQDYYSLEEVYVETLREDGYSEYEIRHYLLTTI